MLYNPISCETDLDFQLPIRTNGSDAEFYLNLLTPTKRIIIYREIDKNCNAGLLAIYVSQSFSDSKTVNLKRVD